MKSCPSMARRPHQVTGVIVAFICVGFTCQTVVAANYQHVLVLSIDGLHEADLTDPLIQPLMPNLMNLMHTGIHYTNAQTVVPSDSFPTSLSYFTGAGPKTTGVYYDDTYNRALYAPGSQSFSSPGTEIPWNETIDLNKNTLSGGGNAGANSINAGVLPLSRAGNTFTPVMPHDYLQVNTVFEVAHNAGLRTAYIEKHPSYEMLNGPSGTGLSDFYAPESNAKAKISNGQLVDDSSKNAIRVTKSNALSEAYDDLRLQALNHQIHGQDSRGLQNVGTPAIYGMNFIAVNTAQKDLSAAGGITLDAGGHEILSSGMQDTLAHTDASLGQIVTQLQATGQYDNTLIVLTSHGGNGPRIGAAVNEPQNFLTGPLATHGIAVNFLDEDDSALLWLADQSKVADAAAVISTIDPNAIAQVLTGSALTAAGFGDPLLDARAPDLVVQFKPGYLVNSGSSGKRAEHGGFSEDDTHVALLLSGGLPDALRGTTIDTTVLQQQIAVTTLEALGLNPALLQGAVLDGTTALPMAVPEPSTWILLVAGSCVLLARRCRQPARQCRAHDQ